MEREELTGDSAWVEGGEVPGLPGAAAFVLSRGEPSAIPVLIAVPHAGRLYPPALVERMRNPGFAALRLEDRYVDRLARGVAAATGAGLLIAQAPRAMIDLNRATDDVDWDMFIHAEGTPPEALPTPGRRALSGLGLIPRRLPGIGEVWKRRHDRSELDARIAGIHEPYHAALAEALDDLRDRWGAALLLDLHSMPPLALRGAPPPEFVVGDRFGATCSGAVIASAFAWFAENRRIAAHNRPYAGGYVLERHARPRRQVHALQLEIDRARYLDSRLAEPGPGFAGMIELLAGLVRRLAVEVATLGTGQGGGRRAGGWAEAAE
ncbi:N-formylglutamate amidohydrolase [Novosphingobium flavum]|uniref:N-formylglutamate amidohydrolase n=1 Tax=Novosphingobium flavum TaxID=1778672 RepID=A0A7X1KMC4_9SPHN|nr:N-formylglutamate amidohydrolase [Novosphingobium flavum]MBC2666477.1 N-formylglutamate amidohydrolase [Novosphingobium flavum]